MAFELNHVQVTQKTVTNRTYNFYIDGALFSPEFDAKLMELRHLAMNSREDDVLEVHFSTPGGAVLIGVDIAIAIRGFRGTVILHVDSYMQSAGAQIFFGLLDHNVVKKVLVHEQASIMFHQISSVSFGKSVELQDYSRALMAWGPAFEKNIMPFLRKKERKMYRNGRDIYYTGKAFYKRLKKRYPNLNVEYVESTRYYNNQPKPTK